MNGIYIALGDSLTTGYGVGLNRSFATLYYHCLLHSFPNFQYENLAVNGLTSSQLVNMVGQANVCQLISKASVITVTIGSNDLLDVGEKLVSRGVVTPELAIMSTNRNLMLLGERIRSVNPTATFKIASIYNPLPSMDKQTNAFTKTLLKTVNGGIRQMSREYRAIVVPVAKAFDGNEQLLLSSDHLHPNIQGHQLMAELFARY